MLEQFEDEVGGRAEAVFEDGPFSGGVFLGLFLAVMQRQ